MNTAMHNNYTRKNRKLPMYANTMCGLQEWYDKKAESLGWMVIAAAKGYDYKIASYKKSLHHLLEAIEHVMTEYTDPDRVHDLEVMHMNVKVLEEFVAKNL
jgi:hypothetical protein